MSGISFILRPERNYHSAIVTGQQFLKNLTYTLQGYIILSERGVYKTVS